MSADAEIGDAAAAGERLPGRLDPHIQRADVGLLGEQERVGGLPDLHRIGAVGERVADQTRRGGIHHLNLRHIHAELLGEELEHHVVGGGAGAGELPAFEILERLDLRPRGHHRAPEIEQVEEIRHLDAADIGKPDRQQ